MRLVCMVLMAVFVITLAACGGSGVKDRPGTPGTKGSIAGKFVVNNALPEGASFSVALFKKGEANPSATAVPSADGAGLVFSFADKALGIYYVQLRASHGGAAASSLSRIASHEGHEIVLAQTNDLTLSSTAPNLSGVTANAIGTDGTISGIVQVAGEYPTGKMVFVYVYRSDITLPPGPPDGINAKTFDVPVSIIENNQFRYDIENISYGTYKIELNGYNPATHEVEVYGSYATEVTLDFSDHNLFSKNFGAGFGVEPPPVQNGSISGSVSFSGTPNWAYPIYVSANTIPPVQGAPPGNIQVTEAAYNSSGTAFEMSDLVYGEYSVSVYQYNFTTHQATYFGSYSGTVTLTEENPAASGITFEADWSLL